MPYTSHSYVYLRDLIFEYETTILFAPTLWLSHRRFLSSEKQHCGNEFAGQ
jgi:hypothetical protein